jgi:hypothetical protein
MTNNKQQTAVEWYAIEMAEYLRSMYGDGIINIDILKQAKEMEKEQIINSFWNGDNTDCTSEQNIKEFAEQYYKQTYGGGEQ